MELDYNVNAVPGRRQCNRKNFDLLQAFCESGKPMAIVRDGTRKAAVIRQCLNVAIKKGGFPCACIVRGETLYLARKDVEDV